MLQLFNNIILIIHYLGFVVLNALFFYFKATRPLIYQPHVASCYLEEKEEPAGNHILSFPDQHLTILYPFIWRNKLYPSTVTSTVSPTQGNRRGCFLEASSGLDLCLYQLSPGKTGQKQSVHLLLPSQLLSLLVSPDLISEGTILPLQEQIHPKPEQ